MSSFLLPLSVHHSTCLSWHSGGRYVRPAHSRGAKDCHQQREKHYPVLHLRHQARPHDRIFTNRSCAENSVLVQTDYQITIAGRFVRVARLLLDLSKYRQSTTLTG